MNMKELSLVSGNGKYGKLHQFRRVMARKKSHQTCQPVWTQMYKKDQLAEQSTDLYERI